MLQNFEGVKVFTGKTETESAVAYRKGDILLSNIRPYLKKCGLQTRMGVVRQMFLCSVQIQPRYYQNFCITPCVEMTL